MRPLIPIGNDYPVGTYLIFRLIDLFPSTMVDHFSAQVNRIYVVFFPPQIGGRGESGIFSRDGEQESEKEEKETG